MGLDFGLIHFMDFVLGECITFAVEADVHATPFFQIVFLAAGTQEISFYNVVHYLFSVVLMVG